MDFDPTSMFVTFIVSGIGFILFSYGRKMSRPPHVIGGLVMMVFPYFIPGPLATGLCGLALLALVWFAVKFGW